MQYGGWDPSESCWIFARTYTISHYETWWVLAHFTVYVWNKEIKKEIKLILLLTFTILRVQETTTAFCCYPSSLEVWEAFFILPLLLFFFFSTLLYFFFRWVTEYIARNLSRLLMKRQKRDVDNWILPIPSYVDTLIGLLGNHGDSVQPWIYAWGFVTGALFMVIRVSWK